MIFDVIIPAVSTVIGMGGLALSGRKIIDLRREESRGRYGHMPAPPERPTDLGFTDMRGPFDPSAWFLWPDWGDDKRLGAGGEPFWMRPPLDTTSPLGSPPTGGSVVFKRVVTDSPLDRAWLKHFESGARNHGGCPRCNYPMRLIDVAGVSYYNCQNRKCMMRFQAWNDGGHNIVQTPNRGWIVIADAIQDEKSRTGWRCALPDYDVSTLPQPPYTGGPHRPRSTMK